MDKLRCGIILDRKKNILMFCRVKREEDIEGNMFEERWTARVLQEVPSSKMNEIKFKSNLSEDHLTKKYQF